MPRTAPAAGTPLALMKDRARRAYADACDAETPLAPLFQRWLAETISAADGKPAAVRVEMFRRTAALFELAADRAGWARGPMR
jgi:hypothetical protein